MKQVRSLGVLLTAWALATPVAHAAEKKKGRADPRPAPAAVTAAPAPAPAPMAPAPVAAPAPAPAAPAAVEIPTVPTLPLDQHLKEAETAFEALEYEVALAHATAALARPDIKDDQRVAAYRLQAGSQAVMGMATESQMTYRLLFRLRPDFQFPPNTPPKIVSGFQAIQAEEEGIRRAVAEAERKRIIESLKLDVVAPTSHQGGVPMDILVKAEDPRGGVRQVTLAYRMRAGAEFATLPLQLTTDGYVARFTEAQTSTPEPVKFEYVVVARDGAGEPLLSVGAPETPRVIALAAGQPEGPPLYRQPLFWVLSAGALGGAVGAVAVVILVGVVLTTVGGTAAYLVTRGDGTPSTRLGRQEYP